MKTHELIDQLVAQAADVRPVSRLTRVVPVAAGLVVTIVLFAVMFPILNPWGEVASTPRYVLRFLFLMALTWGLTKGLSQLFNPALSWQIRWHGVWGLMLLWAIAAAVRLYSTEADARVAMVLGHSWLSCSWALVLLSMPTLAGLLWMARSRAVTRPRLTGAVLGWCAGALTALIYTLHCDETEPAFVLVWYGLGIGLPGLIGAWWGQRLLRC